MPKTQDELYDTQRRLLRRLEVVARDLAGLRRQRQLNGEFFDLLQHSYEKEMWEIERNLGKVYNETWCKMRKKSKKSIPEFLKETK